MKLYLKKAQDYNWERELRKYILLLLLFSVSNSYIYAFELKDKQETLISGKVLDASGEPLIGVSVQEKETINGTITDLDGLFNLNVKDAKSKIVFSYVGYVTQEMEAQNSMTVVLKEDVSILDEIVVMGYGSKRKGGISAAVTTISSEDISRTTSSTTSGAIVGKMAGITARQKSGTPGTGANIQIRNMGTPLYVIDGVMTDEGSFNHLDVNDIENITVLKDGAAAIYGVKAANGVVLVTTKGGKTNTKPTVSINSYLAWQQWTTYPDLMNAYEYNYAQAMQKVNRGVLSNPNAVKQELEKWKMGTYNPATGEDYRNYDWKDNFVDNAAPQEYINVSISGGGEKATYYMSISHINQDAVFKDFNFNRTNLQANFDMQMNKDLKIGYQASGKIENNVGPSLPRIDDAAGDYQLIRNSLFALLPTTRPYANDNSQYLSYLEVHDGRNMAAFTKEHAGSYKNTWKTIRNNISLEYKTPLKGLKASALISYFSANNNNDRNEKGWQEYTYNADNDAYELRYDKVGSGDTRRSRIRENTEDLTGQALLNYDNTFKGKHHITATAGFEFYKRKAKYLEAQQRPVDNIFVDLIGTSENNTLKESRGNYTTASFVFRAGYDYDQRYVIDFAARYDGTWKFPEDNRWGFFPSVSGAWRVSEESFFKDSSLASWFTNLKLRASYGQMGDDMLGGLYPDFAYLSGYRYNQGSALMPLDPFEGNGANKGIVGSGAKGIPISNLTWMKISMIDVGLDLGFLNNKLSVELDLFKRERTGIAARPDDLIFPLESGMEALPKNLNSDQNLGVDGFVKWSDAIGNVKYNLGANITLARQKNGKSYGEQFFNAIDQYQWSKSNRWANVANGDVWMMEVIGVFQSQEQIDNYPVNIDGHNNKNLLPGDLIFKDVNGDGVIDDYDRRPLGYAASDWPWEGNSAQGNKNPLMSFGFMMGAEWKGIDFAADFAGGFMNTYVPAWFTVWGTGVHHTANGFAYNSLDVWRHEDIFDPTSPWISGSFPALRGPDNPSTWHSNTFYNKNVNYLRLRNLVVGYTLPKVWTRKALIEKCRIYFEGTNLFSFDNMKKYGIDPEVSGVQGADYPQHRVYTIGLNLTF